MKEKINIKEQLTIIVRDSKTKKIIKKQVIPIQTPGFFKRILFKIFPFLKKPGTITDFGKEQAARLYGNVGTTYSINEIGGYRDTTWDYKTSNNVYVATGKLKCDNEANPWTTAGSYTKVGCRNSGNANRHNEITVSVSISSGQEWWCEIQFTFS